MEIVLLLAVLAFLANIAPQFKWFDAHVILWVIVLGLTAWRLWKVWP